MTYISVITSYKIPTASDSFKGSLASCCSDMRKLGIGSIDVHVTSSDIEAILTELSEISPIGTIRKTDDISPSIVRDIGERLAADIKDCAASTPKDPELKIAAFATNFPNISNVDPILRSRSVLCLAASIVAADRLGVRVVEIVAGRNLTVEHAGSDTEESFTSTSDKVHISKLTQIFCEGAYACLEVARKALHEQMPRCALAIEIEPDVLALASSTDNTFGLIAQYRHFVRHEEEAGRISEALRSEFDLRLGINFDFGHVLIEIDRERESERDHRLAAVKNRFKTNTDRIFHAHASDHFPGAHWADAPLGSFRDLSQFSWCFELYHAIASGSPDTPASMFFSGHVAIELEATKSLAEVERAVAGLYSLGRINGVWVGTPVTTANDIQTAIRRLSKIAKAEGWLEGINLSLYEVIGKYLVESPSDEKTLIFGTGDDLQLLRNFLCARRTDIRTTHAAEIAKRVFARLKTPSLADWSRLLVKFEYERAFHPVYRDHSVHTVYVWLLGIYFYVTSENVRRLVQGSPVTYAFSNGSPFHRQWALAALSHDLGYVFEALDETSRTRAKEFLNGLLGRFVSNAVDPHYHAIEQDIINAIGATRLTTLTNDPYELAEDVGLFARIGNEFEKHSGIGVAGTKKYFDLARSEQPLGAQAHDRPPFLDHGIMSGAILIKFRELGIAWAKLILAAADNGSIKNIGNYVVEGALCSWATSMCAQVVEDNEIDIVIRASAAHNIFPEKMPDETGFLFHRNQLTRVGLNLGSYELGPATGLAFLLAMCDEAQDWDRPTFANPLDEKTKKKTYTSLDFDLRFDPKEKQLVLECPSSTQMNRKTEFFDYRFGKNWQPYLRFET